MNLKEIAMTNYFLVELTLDYNFVDQLESASGDLNYLLAEGRIQTYAISNEMSRMWITLLADSELEVWDLLGHLSFDNVGEPIVTTLHTYNQSIDLRFPSVSMN